MHRFKTWRWAAILLALVLSLTLIGTAIAATTTRSARTLTRLKVVHGDTATSTTSTTFVDVPGAATSITVDPCGRTTCAVILARFSAESACYGVSGWCSVRILINSKEADPVVGTDFAFDSTSNGNETVGSWESHAVERSRAYFTPGTYSVKVQYATTSSGIKAVLDDWTLVVEAIRT
jgi:hypothetical protein